MQHVVLCTTTSPWLPSVVQVRRWFGIMFVRSLDRWLLASSEVSCQRLILKLASHANPSRRPSKTNQQPVSEPANQAKQAGPFPDFLYLFLKRGMSEWDAPPSSSHLQRHWVWSVHIDPTWLPNSQDAEPKKGARKWLDVFGYRKRATRSLVNVIPDPWEMLLGQGYGSKIPTTSSSSKAIFPTYPSASIPINNKEHEEE